MTRLWQSLNWPQSLLLAAVLVAFLTGVVPVLIHRTARLLEMVWLSMTGLLEAAWPPLKMTTDRAAARLKHMKRRVHLVAQRGKRRAA